MNPIIDVLKTHIANGDRPATFVSAYVQSTTEHGIEVQLSDGKWELHELQPEDHAEFVRWFTEAHNWWETTVSPRRRAQWRG